MSGYIAGARGARLVKEFGRKADGGLTIFSLFVILLMLLAGGLAVDFMRQESARVRLQSTLDRAILAAADMDQSLSPREVVEDYFAKAGLTGYALNVDVADGMTSRRVSATTSTRLDTYFLNFAGINELVAPAAGVAEESVSNIEISLVLDVSTSMRSNQKIDNLKVAAKEFVDTIFAQTTPGKTTISIVPYSTQVNVGPGLLSRFNVTAEHTYSSCVDFTEADYDSTAIGTATLLQRTGHFDPTARESQQKAASFVCRTDAGTEVLPVSSDPEALKQRIDDLVAEGYTSIDVGMKWGSALLDPAARPAITDMFAGTPEAGTVVGRPYDYGPGGETMKIIVVMTDGINTNQWYLDQRYRSGLSDVWRDPVTGRLSFKVLLGYYIPGTGIRLQPYGTNPVQLTYPELWATTSMKYNARQMANGSGNPLDFLRWTDGLLDAVTGLLLPGAYSSVDGPIKDARLQKICSAAKTTGIKVYSIGFEVTADSAQEMRDCATTPSHFFRVNDKEIVDAFQTIANDIGKLRLTQ